MSTEQFKKYGHQGTLHKLTKFELCVCMYIYIKLKLVICLNVVANHCFCMSLIGAPHIRSAEGLTLTF